MSELLRDTQVAFDSVALEYDGPLGNNSLVQRIRARTLAAVRQNLAPPTNLLDLGCGTGLDADTLGRQGYQITAVDWSPMMVQCTKDRITRSSLQEDVEVRQLGFHELDSLRPEWFDGAYSDLGPLNCATDIEQVAKSLVRILKPHGKVIASVIGRICPWEWMYYSLKGQLSRANLRFQPGLVPVPLNGRTVWTQYFMPREFAKIFISAGFKLTSLCAVGLILPPPYMIRFAENHPHLIDVLQSLDDGVATWPVLQNFGDHFLIVMQKK